MTLFQMEDRQDDFDEAMEFVEAALQAGVSPREAFSDIVGMLSQSVCRGEPDIDPEYPDDVWNGLSYPALISGGQLAVLDHWLTTDEPTWVKRELRDLIDEGTEPGYPDWVADYV